MGSSTDGLDRRGFLKGAAGAAALAATPPGLTPDDAPPPAAAPPSPAQIAAEIDAPLAPTRLAIGERPGADFMVDVVKSLGFEYVAANPGSAFRGLHESILNYGGNTTPELLTCCHEESSVAMAHGYAKVEGKPMLVMAHGTVGLQHASMAIYNAYVDRVPVYVVLGNILDATWRRGDVEWAHSVQDPAAMVRDYTKWDDAPVSLGHFAESAVRAYRIATTPPQGPVVLTADAVLQEEPVSEEQMGRLRVPKLTPTSPPAGDPTAVAELARLLVAAQEPLIVCGRTARTARGLELLVELAELLQAPVVEYRRLRMNFPTHHPLYGGGTVAGADLVVALEVPDLFHYLYAQTPASRPGMDVRRVARVDAKVATISSLDLLAKSNYQDFGRYNEVDLAIAADAEATLPALIEACRRMITPERRRAFDERGARIGRATLAAREQSLEQARWGWDASPISTARLAAELWSQIQGEDWSLVSDVVFLSSWPNRLWDFTRHHQFLGGSGAYGIGYGAPAAAGAALANRKHGRLSVNLQCDGDLNYAPAVLWTSAHHGIPLLSVMHNNRSYHQEAMWVANQALRVDRDVRRAKIGNTLTEPNIDYAGLARAYGVWATGPIEDPAELAPAIRRAIEVVKAGEPALVDVVTQPR
jgi:acetolactate synthase-1/2/3 large subunit